MSKIIKYFKLDAIRSLKSNRHFNKASAGAAVILFAAVGTILLFRSHAATPFASLDLGTGSSISPPASVIADGTASGGSAIKFGSAAPSGTRTCPAYPAFPDASCTGVPPGVTLRSCDGNLGTAGAVYDGCLFSGGINVSASNITIKNSKILGDPYSAGGISGIVFIEVEIDGQNSNQDALDYNFGNYSCTRCNVHDATKGFSGSDFTVIDTYVHDIFGEGTVHSEPILGSTGNIVIRHSNLVANWSPKSTGGGMSASIALYTHDTPGFQWGPMDNVVIEQSRMESNEAYYCLYGGYSTTRAPSNIRILNNMFFVNPASGSCGIPGGGPIYGWFRGNGNVWSGNQLLTGTGSTSPLPEPASSPYF